MQILIDDQPVDIPVQPNLTFGAIVDSVNAVLVERRRVMQNILVDGQPVSSEQIEQLQGQPAVQFEQIAFKTACPRRLARETLSAVASMLGDTASLQRGAVDKLAAGQTAKAMEMLLGCLNHFRLAQEAIRQAVQLNRVDLDRVRIGPQSAGEVIKSLAVQLAEVRTALEKRDFAMLADLLNYEFPHATEQWLAIVAELDRLLAE